MLAQKNKYAKIIDQNRELLDPQVSVLEAGSGDAGIARFLNRRVVCLDTSFPDGLNEWVEPKPGSLLEMPFGDQAFDVVVCVDVLHRLEYMERARAIAELIRVARQKIIISCPCGSVATMGERSLVGLFKKFSIGIPPWLAAHAVNGLPEVEDMVEIIINTGYQLSFYGNESINQHYGGILLDQFFEFSQRVHSLTESRSPYESPIMPTSWDMFYSFIFVLRKDSIPSVAPAVKRSPVNRSANAPFEAKLYAVDHVYRSADHLGLVTPIYVGPGADQAPPGTMTDITERTPRLDNRRWCELTAFHKIWSEGPYSDVVGFCHYRRLFDFRTPAGGHRQMNYSKDALIKLTGAFFNEELFRKLPKNALICPPPFRSNTSLWEQYHRATCINDLAHVVGYLTRKHPHLVPFIASSLKEKEIFFANLFVSHWEIFDELCAFLFDVLQDFEKAYPTLRASQYQNREIGFLAERLFHIWIRFKQHEGLQLIHYPIAYISDL